MDVRLHADPARCVPCPVPWNCVPEDVKGVWDGLLGRELGWAASPHCHGSSKVYRWSFCLDTCRICIARPLRLKLLDLLEPLDHRCVDPPWTQNSVPSESSTLVLPGGLVPQAPASWCAPPPPPWSTPCCLQPRWPRSTRPGTS